MAIKFPLEMKNGVQVRNITDLKENFDIEQILKYFLDGKLEKWLEARYYEEEANEVSKLDSNDEELPKKLCAIFGVEYNAEVEINREKLMIRNERITKLKQFTEDSEILKNIDYVAFSQEELADLYDVGTKRIYLCNGIFSIPKSKQNLEYILIGEPVVTGLTQKDESKSDIENKCFNNLNVDDISEELADIIGLRPFVSTDDYIVFVEGEGFALANKHTNDISPLPIAGHDSRWTKLLGADGNRIFLGRFDTISLYDLETKESRNIGNSADKYNGGKNGYYCSFSNGKALYVNEYMELILYDLNSQNTTIIASDVLKRPVLLLDNKVFYTGSMFENGCWDSYFIVYDVDSEQKTKLFDSRGLEFKQMISYKETLYILDYNVRDESIRLLGLNIDNPKDKYTVYFQLSYKRNPTAYLDLCIERAPYFIFIEENENLPMYVFDMQTKEFKQVSSGCGHEFYYLYMANPFFQVVGDYLYFMKGSSLEINDVYRINLRSIGDEIVIGKSRARSYYKNHN